MFEPPMLKEGEFFVKDHNGEYYIFHDTGAYFCKLYTLTRGDVAKYSTVIKSDIGATPNEYIYTGRAYLTEVRSLPSLDISTALDLKQGFFTKFDKETNTYLKICGTPVGGENYYWRIWRNDGTGSEVVSIYKFIDILESGGWRAIIDEPKQSHLMNNFFMDIVSGKAYFCTKVELDDLVPFVTLEMPSLSHLPVKYKKVESHRIPYNRLCVRYIMLKA